MNRTEQTEWPKRWESGKVAYHEGAGYTDCPYEWGNPLFNRWMSDYLGELDLTEKAQKFVRKEIAAHIREIQRRRLEGCRSRIYAERAKRNYTASVTKSTFLSEKAHLAMRVAALLAQHGRYLCDFADEGDVENGPKLTGSCWLQAGGCIAQIEFLSYPDFYNVVWVSCSSRRALRSRGEHAFWPANEPDFGFHFDGKVCLRLPDLIGKNMVNVLHAPSHSLRLQA